jgi:hypothetical protein
MARSKNETEKRLKLQREALYKIKQLTGNSDHPFVQVELPRVSKMTLAALVRKEVLVKSGSFFGSDCPDYYQWTGKEME